MTIMDDITIKNLSKEPASEDLFREAYNYHRPEKESVLRKLKSSLQCSKETIYNFLPIVQWLPKYQFRDSVLNDLIAGFTVTVMHIPHGLAYAPLAEQPPVVGLYMALFPTIIYLFLGTSRHLSLGTFAVVCMMVGKTVSQHAVRGVEHENISPEILDEGPSVMEVGVAVCFIVGLWELIIGLLQLGSLWVLLSNSLVSGFTTGAATHVIIYQLRHILGVSPKNAPGPLKLIYYMIDVARVIKDTNLITLGISLVSITLLVLSNDYLKPFLQKKYPRFRLPIPSELILIILGITLSYFLDLNVNYNVKIVKTIPTGLPEVTVPPLYLFPRVAVDSLVIAIVCVSMSLSLASIFAKKGNYTVNGNQEIISYGLSNMFASFFHCIPATASLSRSLIQFTVGGKSQIASLFMILAMLTILLFLGPLFEPVPYCVLGSVVIVSLKGLIWQFKDLPGIIRQSKMEGVVWLGTFLSVVIIDLDYGLAIGIILIVVTLVLSGQSPRIEILGRVPDTNLFLDVNQYGSSKLMSDVFIIKIYGSLHFANVHSVIQKIMHAFQNYQSTGPPTEADGKDHSSAALILNMSCVPSVDPTGVSSLLTLFLDLAAQNCDLLLTEVNGFVYDSLKKCNFFDKFPRNNVIVTNFDAVQFISSR